TSPCGIRGGSSDWPWSTPTEIPVLSPCSEPSGSPRCTPEPSRTCCPPGRSRPSCVSSTDGGPRPPTTSPGPSRTCARSMLSRRGSRSTWWTTRLRSTPAPSRCSAWSARAPGPGRARSCRRWTLLFHACSWSRSRSPPIPLRCAGRTSSTRSSPTSCPVARSPLGPASPSGEIQIPGVVPGQGGDRPLGIREEVLVARGEGVGPVGDVLFGAHPGLADGLDLLGREVAGALGALELVLVLVVPIASGQHHQVQHQIPGADPLVGALVGGLEVDVVAAQRPIVLVEQPDRVRQVG